MHPLANKLTLAGYQTPTEWCEHIYKNSVSNFWYRGNKNIIANDWRFCPDCGAKHPEPEKKKSFIDVLDEIFMKHNRKYPSREQWIEEVRKDIARAAEEWFRK